MKPYATEVEFLRDEVEKCHASMHSQVETLKLLMEAHLELKKKVERQWVELTDDEIDSVHNKLKTWLMGTYNIKDIYRALEAKLKEKNGG